MILLILSILFQSQPISVSAFETETYFARVMFEQTYFYKTPNEDDSIKNIYFELPKTYFVELLSLTNNFYEARYKDIIGYVKKDCVQAVSGTPSNPFLNNITFRVYSEMSQTIYSAPTIQNNSNIITKIPLYSNNVQYIAKVDGECLILNRTNDWFYCKYNSNGIDYFGYVYSDFCDEITEIVNNTEQLTYINNPTFSTETEPIPTLPKDSNYIGIIVAILSIPAVIFLFMIMKGTKIINHEKTKQKEVIDY